MSIEKETGVSDRILYLFLKGVQKIIEVFPLRPALFLSKLSGRTAFHIMRRRRVITVNNLSRAFPERSRSWAYATAEKVFENFSRNLVEFIKFSSGRYFDHISVEGFDRITGPGILLMAHYGHWEITGMYLPASGVELYPVGRRIHSKAFDMLVDDLRTAFGSRHIPYKKSIREIFRKLRRGKNICVLVDQRMKSGYPVSFFNRPVLVTQLIPTIYRRRRIRVTPSYSRHIDGRIHIKYQKPLNFVQSEDPLKADMINTRMQMRWLEEVVRDKPEEWFWMHNFWKGKWRAVFLDRDGTINEDHGYVSDFRNFNIIPGAFEAIRELRKEKFLIVVLTNQSGIARGYYSENDYLRLNESMLELFNSEGAFIDRVYYCPHHPGDKCVCRKPSPHLGLLAQKELNIDFSRSYMIGDKPSDMEFARNLNMRSVIVKTGEGLKRMNETSFDLSAEDLYDASRKIIREKKDGIL